MQLEVLFVRIPFSFIADDVVQFICSPFHLIGNIVASNELQRPTIAQNKYNCEAVVNVSKVLHGSAKLRMGSILGLKFLKTQRIR